MVGQRDQPNLALIVDGKRIRKVAPHHNDIQPSAVKSRNPSHTLSASAYFSTQKSVSGNTKIATETDEPIQINTHSEASDSDKEQGEINPEYDDWFLWPRPL